eukprot:scaffold470_cov194-Amphora_coffeaeformis.AAC.4
MVPGLFASTSRMRKADHPINQIMAHTEPKYLTARNHMDASKSFHRMSSVSGASLTLSTCFPRNFSLCSSVSCGRDMLDGTSWIV